MVKGSPVEGGIFEFEAMLTRSNHSTVRVIVFDESLVDELRRRLRRFGCESEFAGFQSLIAVDVPPNVSYEPVRTFLELEEQNDRLSFEQSALRHG